jgi:hypothetical protein
MHKWHTSVKILQILLNYWLVWLIHPTGIWTYNPAGIVVHHRHLEIHLKITCKLANQYEMNNKFQKWWKYVFLSSLLKWPWTYIFMKDVFAAIYVTDIKWTEWKTHPCLKCFHKPGQTNKGRIQVVDTIHLMPIFLSLCVITRMHSFPYRLNLVEFLILNNFVNRIMVNTNMSCHECVPFLIWLLQNVWNSWCVWHLELHEFDWYTLLKWFLLIAWYAWLALPMHDFYVLHDLITYRTYLYYLHEWWTWVYINYRLSFKSNVFLNLHEIPELIHDLFDLHELGSNLFCWIEEDPPCH